MPCGGNIYARLLSSKYIENHVTVNKYIDEFNINRFKMLTIEEGCCNISNSLLNNHPYQFLSDEILIYNFNFYNDNIQLNNKTCKLTANKDGKCIGILIYFDILVDDDNIINIIEKNENIHWESRLFRTLDLNKEINNKKSSGMIVSGMSFPSDKLDFEQTQNYIPIFNLFFSLNENNYNNINLENSHYLIDIVGKDIVIGMLQSIT